MGTFQQIKTDITHVGNIGRYGSLLHMRGKYFDDPFCSNEGFKGNDGCFALPPLPVEVHAMAKFLRTVAAFLASPTSLVGIVIKSSREASSRISLRHLQVPCTTEHLWLGIKRRHLQNIEIFAF